MLAITVCVLTIAVCWPLSTKAAGKPRWPTSKAAQRWKPDRQWLRGAFCVHRHESVDWHRAYTDWTGAPSPYSGGFQFLASTWRAAGGIGHAYQWSPREQFYRAWITWLRAGRSWSQWGTRGACGLA